MNSYSFPQPFYITASSPTLGQRPPQPLNSLILQSADAAAHAAETVAHLASSPDPPSYAASFSSPGVKIKTTTHSNGSHPRVAVLLGVNARWHIPLLMCRALSTAPAAWWGLRCAFTFLGELLRSDETRAFGDTWTVEKRFRVTEVFLAILWVRRTCGVGRFNGSSKVLSAISREGDFG